MVSARGIRAGAAYIELFISDSRLVRGLEKASKRLKAFGSAVRDMGTKLATVGAAVLAPLAGSAKLFSDMGDKLAKMSQRTGISVETLSELGFAAEQSGTDIDTLEVGVRKMQKTLVDASEGSQSAVDTLAKLGLTVADFEGLSVEQKFKLIADRIAQLPGPTQRAAAALEIFGRSGTQLIPLLKDGARGMQELQEQARALGLTISTEDAQAAERFNDTLNILWKVLKQGVFVIGAALAPTLTRVAQWLTRTAIITTEWIKRNKEVIVTILKVAAVAVAFGGALIGLGYVISTLGTILGAVAAMIAGVGTVLGALVTVLSAILTPIGLVVTAIAALGAYILYATGVAAKGLSWLGDRFGNLKDTALTAWQGISDALAAGDIALAAKILWLTLKMEWLKGVKFLESAWLQFRNFFIKIAYDAFYGALAALEIVWHGLEVAWIETTAFLSKLWTSFTSGFQKAWNTAVTWVEKRLHDLHGLFDSSFDAEQAKQMADEALQATNDRIDQEKQAALQQREQRRQSERDKSKAEHEATLAVIGQESIDKEKALDKEFNDRMKASQDEIDKTRKEWEDAIAEAARKRKAAEGDQGPPTMRGPDDFADELNNLNDVLDRASQHTIDVVGTFNAMEAPGLGAGGVTDRIAKASEETAKNTKRLLQEAQEGGLTFA